MHVVFRSSSGQGASELLDLLGQREEDVRALISGVPGSASYAAFRSNGGGGSVTVCQDKAGTRVLAACGRVGEGECEHDGRTGRDHRGGHLLEF